MSSCGVQSAECSSLKWSMVCKFGGTKEIVYINEAFKSHRIFVEHQHDDGPHVSNYDKLSTKTYMWIPLGAGRGLFVGRFFTI